MKPWLRSLPYCLALPALVSVSAHAHAHFKLLKPNAWIMEDAQGNPQKQGPCGTDPSSATMTNEVTEVKAGEEVMVEIQETIHHPGWFRISLAKDRSEFEEIKFPNANCTYDMSTVPKEPHGNVLADGLEMDENLGGSNRKIMQMVKIPDQPCDKCTLQVIQVMADAVHSPPGCIYYHCADLKIVGGSGDGQAAAGSGGSAAPSGSAGAAAGGSAASAGTGGSATSGSASGSAGSAASAMSTASTAAAGTGGSNAASKPAASTSSGSAGATGTRTNGAASTASSTKPANNSGAAGSTSATKTDDAAAPASETKSEDGGCSIARSPAADLSSAAWLAAIGLFLAANRKRQRA